MPETVPEAVPADTFAPNPYQRRYLALSIELFADGKAATSKAIAALAGLTPDAVRQWKRTQPREFWDWLDGELTADARRAMGAIRRRVAGIAQTKGSTAHAELSARLAGELLDGRERGAGDISITVQVATALPPNAAWSHVLPDIEQRAKVEAKVQGESATPAVLPAASPSEHTT